MTASYWTQVRLNFWKSFLVRKRKPVKQSFVSLFGKCLSYGSFNLIQWLWAFEVGWPIAIISVVAIFHALIGTYEFRTCNNLDNLDKMNMSTLNSSLLP